MENINYLNLTIGNNKSLNSCKKKAICITNWKDKKLQLLRNAGKPYVNKRGNGNVIPGKDFPVTTRGCTLNCKKEGCSILTIETVHQLFKRFYELNYNEQTSLLLQHVKIREIVRRRPGILDESARKLATYDYEIQGKSVCLKTIMNVFSITKKRVEVLQNKLKEGQIAPKDQRGHHLNRPHAINFESICQIKNHIKSFPVEESHYSRNASQKKMLKYGFVYSKNAQFI